MSYSNRALHWLAILTALATFPLIFMGGLVTSHGAGMAVPDWPNTFGYNMFTFPPSRWVGGVLYEHTHRLAGTVVGMLSIAMCVWAFRTERRRWVRGLSAAILGAVIVQGVLGGLRVVWVNLDLAIVHACVAQAFFCLTAVMVAVTSRWWTEGRVRQITPGAGALPVARLAFIACAIIYLQLIAGALMRHYQAGLAIPDFPLSYGRIVPPFDASSLGRINALRMQDGLEPVTAGQIAIHFVHRLGAVAVLAAVAQLVGTVVQRYRHNPLLLRPALLLSGLLVVQIVLGILTVLWRKPADIASAHVALGALTLFTTFMLGLRALAEQEAPQPPGLGINQLNLVPR